jgi:hypothetical protein
VPAARSSLLVVAVALILGLAPAVAAQNAGELRALSLDIQAVASDPERTSVMLAEWADRTGGYYVFRSAERVELRVSADQANVVRDLLEEGGDEIVLYAPSTVDYRSELRDIEAAITSRSESLDRVLAFLADANVSATLAFERELRSLNEEIEYYEGRRRAILNDSRYARVTVRLSVRTRSIPSAIPSSFPWINSISLYRFIDRLNEEGRR